MLYRFLTLLGAALVGVAPVLGTDTDSDTECEVPVLGTDFRIVVDPNDIVATQSDWFHGINSEADVHDRYAMSPGATQAMAAAGFKAARFPGGNPSDYYDWSCPYWVDSKGGLPGECPSAIDEIYFDESSNVIGDVWQFYATGGVIDNSGGSDLPVSGPESAYLDCLKDPPSARCSHYNVGRASTSDFWGWMTGYSGNPHVSAPVEAGVSPEDFVHVAGPPQRPMSGFGARRMLVQTNVFGVRPLDVSHLEPSLLLALRDAHDPLHLVEPKTPNRGDQHAGHWAASIHRAGIEAFYEVGNEPDGFMLEDAKKIGFCGTSIPCQIDTLAYIQSSVWLDMYTNEFSDHAEKIRNNDPDAKVFGPAAVSSSVDLRSVGWYVLEQFAWNNSRRPRSQQADGLSFHYYPDGPSESQKDLFDDLGLPAGDCAQKPWIHRRSLASLHLPWVLAEVNYHARHYGRRMPLVVSEWHLGNPDDREYNRSYGLALATLDVVAAFARRGIEAHQFHSLHTTGPFHSPETLNCSPGCEPWRNRHEGYHGYGLLSGILDQFGGNLSISPQPPDTPTATYYTMALWQHMGPYALGTAESARFPMSMGAPPSQDEVAVHVHRDENEDLQILVINKTSRGYSISVQLNDYTISGNYPTLWSIDPVSVYNDKTILTELGSLRYNGSIDPGYSPNLPPPGNLLMIGNELNLIVPAYGVRLAHVSGEISQGGSGPGHDCIDDPDCIEPF